MRVLAAWVTLVGLTSCHGTAPTDSPRAVADTVVGALDQGDVQRFLSVLPAEAQLGQAFDCGHSDTLRTALRRRLDDLRSELEARRNANFRMRLLAFDEPGSETTELAPGDVFQGCTVRTAVVVHRSRVALSRKRAGRNEDTRELWTFLRFERDGAWFYGKF